MKPQKVLVACPKCGHSQQEPPAAYSTVCRNCRQHFRLDEVLPSAPNHAPAKGAALAARTAAPAPGAEPRRQVKRVVCFQCGTELEVPPSAQSTMCKRCSAHVDLQDYRITATLSKNLRTKGRIIVEAEGCLLNTDSYAGEAVLKGKLIGKLTADSLEIHQGCQIKGSFKAGKLIIPAGTVLRWPPGILLKSADIAGELVANVKATGTVILRATAHFFGEIEARNVVIESGAVIVGALKTGSASTVKEVPILPPGVALAAKPGQPPAAATLPIP